MIDKNACYNFFYTMMNFMFIKKLIMNCRQKKIILYNLLDELNIFQIQKFLISCLRDIKNYSNFEGYLFIYAVIMIL